MQPIIVLFHPNIKNSDVMAVFEVHFSKSGVEVTANFLFIAKEVPLTY